MPGRMTLLIRGLGLLLACIPGALAQERIVSTDAAATQILFALGADSQLVGVDVTSALPAGYRELPSVGYHRALPAEGLLALEPTLVIGSDNIGPPKVLGTLAAAGIHTLRLPVATTVAELKENIAGIAEAVGGGERAGPLLAELDDKAGLLAASPLSAERMAFVLSVEPGKLRLAGQGTAGNAFINLLGARNVADFDAYRTLSAEAVLALAPTVILVAGHEGASPERVLALNAILRHGGAARSGRILPVEAANLVAGLSPAAVTEAVQLAAAVTLQPGN